MKIVDKMKDETLGAAVLYNFTKGYEKPVPMNLYEIVLPMIYDDDFRSEILHHDTLKEVIDACIGKRGTFGADIKKAIQEDGEMTNKAEGLALIQQMLRFDIIDGTMCGMNLEATIMDFNECLIFGRMMQDKSVEDVMSMISGKPARIVVLQSATIGTDVDMHLFDDLGDVSYYEQVRQDQVIDHAKEAEIIVTNKNHFGKEEIDACPNVKLICLLATGYNNIDTDYAKEKGIKVANVKGYSTSTVVQLTMALAMGLIEKTAQYDHFVKSHAYEQSGCFSYFDYRFHDVASLTWGIVGLGEIGKKVAEIAKLMGAHVIYYSTGGAHEDPDFERVDFETLLKNSDLISIHAPLNEKTENLFNRDAFKKMKSTAYLINVGRGPIVNEKDLASAINEEMIAGAGLDVFDKEPLPSTSPLYTIKDNDRVILTPHIGWGSIEARQRLIKEVYMNIESFLQGKDRNIVNGL